jgi:hypothetical protein
VQINGNKLIICIHENPHGDQLQMHDILALAIITAALAIAKF